MVPAVTEGGRSFKGAALYYLHDKRQAGEAERLTTGRVAWTHTFNLSTDDPERAWRIMAHTAMSQAALKAAAGEKATGRKLTKPVHAYSLAWHPEQRGQGVTREHMLAAALDSIKAQGLEGYQAIILAHDDEPQPHVHIIVNRVHPETGKAATLSNCKLKLSQWAEGYEREHGKIYCDKRVENNARRKEGEFVRDPRIPRPVYEFNKSVANDSLTADFVRSDQKQKDAQLYATGRLLKDNHAKQWAELKRVYAISRKKIHENGDRQKEAKARDVRNEQKFKWKFLFSQQRYDREQFERREKGMLTKLFNAASVLRELRRDREGDAISTLFALLSGRERRMALTAMQERERKELANRIKDLTQKACAGIDGQTRAELDKLRGHFLRECEKLKETQERQRGEMRDAWKTRNAERKEALAPLRTRGRTAEEQKRGRGRGRPGRSRSAEDHGRGRPRPR